MADDEPAMGVGQFSAEGEPQAPKVWCDVCNDRFTYSHFDGNGWHSVPFEDIDRAPLDFRSYMELAAKYDLYPEGDQGFIAGALGVANEGGEVAGLAKKMMRGDFKAEPTQQLQSVVMTNGELLTKTQKELGDVMWYIAKICRETGLTMQEILVGNIHKLEDRLNRGVIQGSGDNR